MDETTTNVVDAPAGMSRPGGKPKFDQLLESVNASLEKKDTDKAKQKLETLLAEKRQHEQALRQLDAQIAKLRQKVEAGLPIG